MQPRFDVIRWRIWYIAGGFSEFKGHPGRSTLRIGGNRRLCPFSACCGGSMGEYCQLCDKWKSSWYIGTCTKIEEIDDELVIKLSVWTKKSKSVLNLVWSTHLEIPDREKGGIERKDNFINYFIVPLDICVSAVSLKFLLNWSFFYCLFILNKAFFGVIFLMVQKLFKFDKK